MLRAHMPRAATKQSKRSRTKHRNTKTKHTVKRKTPTTTTTTPHHHHHHHFLHTKPPRNPNHNTVQPTDITTFCELIGENNVLTDPDLITPYNKDWTNKFSGHSNLVLTPTTTLEVSAVLKYCNERALPVVVSGGMTGLVFGATPVHDEIVLSTKKLNKILSFSPYNNILTCEGGVILQDLLDYLEPFNCTTPLDLGSKGSCMIGGNLSTNAGGLRYIRYGSLRGTTLGLEVVTPTGEVLDLLSQAMRKNNTGLDLKQLVIGAEGSLGVITKCAIVCPPKLKNNDVLYIQVNPDNIVYGEEDEISEKDEKTKKQKNHPLEQSQDKNQTLEQSHDKQFATLLDIAVTAKTDLYEVLYAMEYHDSYASE